MPPRLLLKWLTSQEITELRAFKRRNTLNPDLWYSQLQVARAGGFEGDYDQFIPLCGIEQHEARRQRADKD